MSLSHGKSNFLSGALGSRRGLRSRDWGFLSFRAFVMHFHDLSIFSFSACVATPGTLIIVVGVIFLFSSSLGSLTALVLI